MNVPAATAVLEAGRIGEKETKELLKMPTVYEEEIVHVRFREAVIFNRLTETHLDVRKHKNLMISWHPKGVLLEADGVPKVVVPAGNIAWVEIK